MSSERSRGQIRQGLVSQGKNFGFYFKLDGEPLKSCCSRGTGSDQ